MSLSKYALNLFKYLGIYKVTATEFDRRLSGGVYDRFYNASWVEGGVDTTPRRHGVTAHSTRGSLFAAAISELKAAGY